jgi:hypothetical protein
MLPYPNSILISPPPPFFSSPCMTLSCTERLQPQQTSHTLDTVATVWRGRLVVLEPAKLGRHGGESGIEPFGHYRTPDQDASLELSHHKSIWSLVASLVNSKPRFGFWHLSIQPRRQSFCHILKPSPSFLNSASRSPIPFLEPLLQQTSSVSFATILFIVFLTSFCRNCNNRQGYIGTYRKSCPVLRIIILTTLAVKFAYSSSTNHPCKTENYRALLCKSH